MYPSLNRVLKHSTILLLAIGGVLYSLVFSITIEISIWGVSCLFVLPSFLLICHDLFWLRGILICDDFVTIRSRFLILRKKVVLSIDSVDKIFVCYKFGTDELGSEFSWGNFVVLKFKMNNEGRTKDFSQELKRIAKNDLIEYIKSDSRLELLLVQRTYS